MSRAQSALCCLTIAFLGALLGLTPAEAQTSSTHSCDAQRTEFIESMLVSIDNTPVVNPSIEVPITSGEVAHLRLETPDSLIAFVAECLDPNPHAALRLSISSTVRLNEGDFFSRYQPSTVDTIEHSIVDFKIDDMQKNLLNAKLDLDFSLWTAGTQEIRADIIDLKRKNENIFDEGLLVAKLDVAVGAARPIEDVLLASDNPNTSTSLRNGLIMEVFNDFFRIRDNEQNLLFSAYGEEAHASPTGRFAVAISDQGFRLFDIGARRKVYDLDLSGFTGARDHRLNAVAWSENDSYLVVSFTAQGAVIVLPTTVDIANSDTWRLGSFSWSGTRREEPGTASQIRFDLENMTFQSFYAERSLVSRDTDVVVLCDHLQGTCPETGLKLGSWDQSNWNDPSVNVTYFRAFGEEQAAPAAFDASFGKLSSSHNFYRHRVAYASYLRRDSVISVPKPIFWVDNVNLRFSKLLAQHGFDIPNTRDLPRVYTTDMFETTRLKREFEKLEEQRGQSVDTIDLSVFGMPFFMEKEWLDDLVELQDSEGRKYAEGYMAFDEEARAETAEDLIHFPNDVQNTYQYYAHNGLGLTLIRQGFSESAFDKLLYYEPWSGQPDLLSEEEHQKVDNLDAVISECNGANGYLERILPWAVRDVWYYEDASGNRFWIFQSSCTGGLRGEWHHGQLLILKVDGDGNWDRLNLSDSQRCAWDEACHRLGLERASVRLQLMNDTHFLIEGYANTLSVVELDTLQEVAVVGDAELPNASLILPDSSLENYLALAPDGRLSIRRLGDESLIADGSFIDDELILRRPTGYYFATAEGSDFIRFGFNGDPNVYSADQLANDLFVEHGLLKDMPLYTTQSPRIAPPPNILIADSNDAVVKIKIEKHALASKIYYFADGSLREEIDISTNHQTLFEQISLSRPAHTHEFIRVSDGGTRSKRLLLETEGAASGALYFFTVGYGAYTDPNIGPLKYSETDALAWCEHLLGQAESRRYTRVVDLSGGCKPLGGEALTSIISNLPDMVTADDTVVGFLSGHGVRSGGDGFFLLPDTADLNRLDETAISWNQVAKDLNRLNARTVLFLDACHSGFATDLTTNDDLVALIDTPNVTVISASKGRQLSWEVDELNAGVFSKAILTMLNDLESYDTSGDGALDPEEIYRTTRLRVSRFTEASQTPWISRRLPVNGGPLF